MLIIWVHHLLGPSQFQLFVFPGTQEEINSRPGLLKSVHSTASPVFRNGLGEITFELLEYSARHRSFCVPQSLGHPCLHGRIALRGWGLSTRSVRQAPPQLKPWTRDTAELPVHQGFEPVTTQCCWRNWSCPMWLPWRVLGQLAPAFSWTSHPPLSLCWFQLVYLAIITVLPVCWPESWESFWWYSEPAGNLGALGIHMLQDWCSGFNISSHFSFSWPHLKLRKSTDYFKWYCVFLRSGLIPASFVPWTWLLFFSWIYETVQTRLTLGAF